MLEDVETTVEFWPSFPVVVLVRTVVLVLPGWVAVLLDVMSVVDTEPAELELLLVPGSTFVLVPL